MPVIEQAVTAALAPLVLIDPAGSQLEHPAGGGDEPRRGLDPGAWVRAVQHCGRRARNAAVYNSARD